MEISFACGAFAEVASYDTRDDVWILKGLYFERVGSAGGLRDLCGERGRYCVLKLSCYLGDRWNEREGELTMFSS